MQTIPVIVNNSTLFKLNDTVAKSHELFQACEEAKKVRSSWEIQLPVAVKDEFLDLLSEFATDPTATSRERNAVQKLMLKVEEQVAEVFERLQEAVECAEDGSVGAEVVDLSEYRKKKGGGHKTPDWKSLPDDELEEYLLDRIYISDTAWTAPDEIRLPGESRANFIQRIFEERRNS